MSDRIPVLRRTLPLVLAAALLAGLVGLAAGGPDPSSATSAGSGGGKAATIKMFAPDNGDRAGLGSKGWFVDLSVDFNVPLDRTGFTGLQLTGPAAHNNAAPFPGSFSMGQDDRFKGLVVLVATNQAGAGHNVANLFNLTGVTNRDEHGTQIWDTWIVGAPVFGRNVNTTVYSAIVDDLDHNGIYDDAPDTVKDANGDGAIDANDLEALGLASNVEQSHFFITD